MKQTTGAVVGATLGAGHGSVLDAFARGQPAPALNAVDALPDSVTRTWLGPSYWANRLQDWRLHQGWIECVTGVAGDEVRTVAILTREVVSGATSAHLSVRAAALEASSRGGFCGFLIGAGAGSLDYRAAALVQKASGIGGGMLCTWEPSGRLRFREHTDETNPLAFADLPAESVADVSTPPREVVVRLDVTPESHGTFELRLSASDPTTDTLLTGAVRRHIPEADVVGGIALVSSPAPGQTGGRFAFRDLRTGGDKIAVRSERAFGPIAGTLHSLNGNVLKLSAQFMPVGETEPRTATLQYRAPGGSWRDGPTAGIEPGFTTQFRVSGWDPTREWEYRVGYRVDTTTPHYYAGTIRKDPADGGPLTIALFSCAIAAARSLEGGAGQPELPQAELLGRYTHKNIYAPHGELVANAGRHQPHLLVFAGDQLYENSPTRRDNSLTPTLDYLYKWYLWVWSFREMTRSTPTIVLVDDHDVYHGNVWGNGGRAAPDGDQNKGGYRCTADFVNIVQRTQSGHNPDPYDPTPVDRGIGVYYGAFHYGGVSFALLEDRKFKTAPIQGTDLDVHEGELLGDRQEAFLEAWARDRPGGQPKICLTQTLFACVQTSPAGRPLLDFDSNGYPKLQRDRAIDLLRRAGALVLAGDQHLASVVRHGVDTFTDGVVQFTGPAMGTSWQRWFEPARPLPNGRGTPSTGDFSDAFGNKVRVLAVANPKVTFREYRATRKGRAQGLGDRRLKSEGYGIVRVDRKARAYAIECWPWNVDPLGRDARQFPGWPFRLRFDDCDGRAIK